jgi:hypothetical protein
MAGGFRFFCLEIPDEPANFLVLSTAQVWRQGTATRSSAMLQWQQGSLKWAPGSA